MAETIALAKLLLIGMIYIMFACFIFSLVIISLTKLLVMIDRLRRANKIVWRRRLDKRMAID